MQERFKYLLLAAILLLGFFLRFYHLKALAMFIGDQGRDYLVAKEILVNHRFPLIGPQTSIPWIYLGPFFYYFLAIFLWLGKFDPVWPAYGTALFGVFTIYLIYLLGKKIKNEETGLLASFFYAISPYAVLQSRVSLHPSILPFFVILYLIFLLKFNLLGQILSFLIAVQLHLSAILLLPIFFVYREWVKTGENKSLRKLKSFRVFMIGILGMIVLKIFKGSPFTPFSYWWKMFEEIFSYGDFLGAILALGIVFLGMIRVIKDSVVGSKILLISFLFIVCGLTVKNSQAEHYFNLFLPVIILIFSWGLEELLKFGPKRFFAYGIIFFFLVANCFLLINSSYFLKFYGPGMEERKELANFIVNDSAGKPIILRRCGPLWDYSSTNMNYEYLVWWLTKGKFEKDQSKGILYYILEPKEAFKTKEGCAEIDFENYLKKEFNHAFVLKEK